MLSRQRALTQSADFQLRNCNILLRALILMNELWYVLNARARFFAVPSKPWNEGKVLLAWYVSN